MFNMTGGGLRALVRMARILLIVVVVMVVGGGSAMAAPAGGLSAPRTQGDTQDDGDEDLGNFTEGAVPTDGTTGGLGAVTGGGDLFFGEGGDGVPILDTGLLNIPSQAQEINGLLRPDQISGSTFGGGMIPGLGEYMDYNLGDIPGAGEYLSMPFDYIDLGTGEAGGWISENLGGVLGGGGEGGASTGPFGVVQGAIPGLGGGLGGFGGIISGVIPGADGLFGGGDDTAFNIAFPQCMMDPVGCLFTGVSESLNGAASTIIGFIMDLVENGVPIFDAGHPAFAAHYAFAFGIAIFVMILMVMWTLLRAARHPEQMEEVKTSLFHYLPLGMVLCMIGPGLGTMLSIVSSQISDAIIDIGGGIELENAYGPESGWDVGVASIGTILIQILLCFVMIIAAFMMLIMFLLQAFALYITGAIMAIAFMMMIDPSSRPKALKLPAMWIGIVFAKPLMFFVLGLMTTILGIGQLDNALVSMLAQIVGLFVVAFAPLKLMKHAPILPGDGAEMTGSQEAGKLPGMAIGAAKDQMGKSEAASGAEAKAESKKAMQAALLTAIAGPAPSGLQKASETVSQTPNGSNDSALGDQPTESNGDESSDSGQRTPSSSSSLPSPSSTGDPTAPVPASPTGAPNGEPGKSGRPPSGSAAVLPSTAAPPSPQEQVTDQGPPPSPMSTGASSPGNGQSDRERNAEVWKLFADAHKAPKKKSTKKKAMDIGLTVGAGAARMFGGSD